jgi:hypothetical protein
MPDFEALAFPATIVIAVIVLGWFAFGTQANVRAGDRILKWLRDGLPIIGEKTTMHWMGSSVLQLKIAKAKGPFRNAETLFVFEPRDVIFLWLLSRWQGRRDLMIFRGTLNTAPTFECEVFDPKGWTTHNTERDLRKKNWSPVDLTGQPGLQGYYSGAAGAFVAKSLVALATRAGGKLVRLSIHRNVPNVEVHWLLADTQTVSAHDWFANLREIGDQAMRS